MANNELIDPQISETTWGHLADGREVSLFSMMQPNGLRVDISNLGGTIVNLFTPDREGNLSDITLGFPDLESYVAKSPYFGCIVGRYGNRIAGGKFSIDGVDFAVSTNESPSGVDCSLHGGLVGFDKRVWKAETSVEMGNPKLTLDYVSPDGEEGYPGELSAKVVYTLTTDSLVIEYYGTSTAPTPFNPTNHAYFNLSGNADSSILEHHLVLNASHFTPVGSDLIPTGELTPVDGTPFDFRTQKSIGDRIESDNEQLKIAGGYDHNFVIDRTSEGLALTASLSEPNSGRVMEIWTTEPGIQLYSGNFLDGSLIGKSTHGYQKRFGLCLETQHFPDSPNQPSFPNTILRPGEKFYSRTEHRFSVQ